MNYLTIELSFKTWVILGGVTTIVAVLIVVWLANRYHKSKYKKTK